MKRTKRLFLTGMSVGAMALAGAALPTMAAAAPAQPGPPAPPHCTYHADPASHSFSGKCVGKSPFGTMSGSLSGKFDQSGKAAGSFKMTSPRGSGSGSFQGQFGPKGGAGTFTSTSPFGTFGGGFVGTPA